MPRAGEFPFSAAEPSLPGAAELLTGGGQERLARFLGERGWEPESLEPVQLLYRPQRSLAVRFRAGARQATTGARSTFTLTAECRAAGSPPPPAPPAGLLDDPVAVSGPYLLWAFPYDPSLPGLPAAAHGPLVRRRMSAQFVAVEPLRYRPRRRAVLRYRVGHGAPAPGAEGADRSIAFAKVLPPDRAEAALAAADLLRRRPAGRLRLALPVRRLGQGALLVPPVEGHCLRTLLLGGGRLPAPERIARLPDDLSEAAGPVTPEAMTAGNTRRRAQLSRAERAAEVVTRLLPGLSTAARRLVESFPTGEAVDERIVHGDLYEGQVIVADHSLGLVDLDDVGPGDPVLDAATFSAHLLVLAASAGAAAGRVLGYRQLVRTAFLHRLAVDPRELAWREAYAMLLLAPGPVRVLHSDWAQLVASRVEMAERLLHEGG